MSGDSETKQPSAVLFACAMNAVRSPMAAAITRHLFPNKIYVASVGVHEGEADPFAAAVMDEIGIDISSHTSKHMNDFLDQEIDTVVTVCGNADQACPMFPGQVNRYHWGFADPAHAEGSDEEVMNEFRKVRDQIKLVFEAFVAGYRKGRG